MISVTEVSGGTINFSAYFGDLLVYKGTEDLCRRSKCDADKPNKRRRFAYKAREVLPLFTPPGEYSVEITAADDQGLGLLCVRATLPVMPAEA